MGGRAAGGGRLSVQAAAAAATRRFAESESDEDEKRVARGTSEKREEELNELLRAYRAHKKDADWEAVLDGAPTRSTADAVRGR